MTEIFVLVEHRKGELIDITFEMLSKARDLTDKRAANITAVLIGHNVEEFAEKLADHAHQVFIINDIKLKNFDAEAYSLAKLAYKIMSMHCRIVEKI